MCGVICVCGWGTTRGFVILEFLTCLICSVSVSVLSSVVMFVSVIDVEVV